MTKKRNSVHIKLKKHQDDNAILHMYTNYKTMKLQHISSRVHKQYYVYTQKDTVTLYLSQIPGAVGLTDKLAI